MPKGQLHPKKTHEKVGADYAGKPNRESEGYKLYVVSDRGIDAGTVHAIGRRLSESRMRETLTYGSRWQGMETRIINLKRYSLTLPHDRAFSRGYAGGVKIGIMKMLSL